MIKVLLIQNKPRHGWFHERPWTPSVGERFGFFYDDFLREVEVTEVRKDEDAPNIIKCFIDFI